MPLGRLDHFEILRFLGRGGWGDVFLARDTHLDCDVALKVLHPEFADNHEYRDRLRGEAHTLAQLDHPNIVGVLAYNEAAPDPPGCLWPGQPGPHPARVHYLAMRFVEGHDLAAEITGRLLPLERVLDYAKQIGRGLHAAHSHNIIHRDLKPANIRVTPDGVLKLLDFGLARSPRAIQDSLRSTQSMSREYIVGTLGYMCPEQARTGMRPDARCDLFSYGVILYELLTGRRPFAGDGLLELFSEMAQHEPPPMSRYRADVPPALDQVVRRLLQTDPQKRHLTAAEVVEALEQVVLKPPGLLARLRAWLAPHGGRMLRVATAAAVVVAAALWGPGAIERSREWFIPRPEVVAVPDLQNLTDDPAMDRLLAGLSTDLVTSLVRAGGVNVVRPTLRDSAGRPERDPRKLRRTYGASAVLSGSLRTGGGPLGGPAFALHIESVSTRDQRVLWVEELHAPPGQIGRLRAALVQGALAHFSGDAGPAADLDTQRPIAADEAYLRGLGWLTDVNDPVARDSALAEFDRALALAPDYGRALAGRARTLGWIYAREQDPVLMEQAERDARRAIASAPAEYEGRLALARILLDRGRTPDAILELQAVLAGNPRLADAHTQIANAQRKVGRLDDADTHYQAAIALAPDDQRHHRAYGAFLLQSRADSPGAKAEFRRVIELTPDENRGHELLAAAYMTECRFAEALETFRRRPHPDQWTHDARANHATANFFAGRYPEALRDYLDVASAFPNDGVTRMSLGDCYARMGRRADALDAYRLSLRLLERALVVNPDDPNLHAWHSMSLAKAGDVSGAKAELAEHFPTLAVTDAEVLHTVAKALALCGERSRAIAAVDTLVRGRGFSPCLLAVEDELESLRSDQRFRKLVRRPPP